LGEHVALAASGGAAGEVGVLMGFPVVFFYDGFGDDGLVRVLAIHPWRGFRGKRTGSWKANHVVEGKVSPVQDHCIIRDSGRTKGPATTEGIVCSGICARGCIAPIPKLDSNVDIPFIDEPFISRSPFHDKHLTFTLIARPLD
jgi:hypothetical protein